MTNDESSSLAKDQIDFISFREYVDSVLMSMTSIAYDQWFPFTVIATLWQKDTSWISTFWNSNMSTEWLNIIRDKFPVYVDHLISDNIKTYGVQNN